MTEPSASAEINISSRVGEPNGVNNATSAASP